MLPSPGWKADLVNDRLIERECKILRPRVLFSRQSLPLTDQELHVRGLCLIHLSHDIVYELAGGLDWVKAQLLEFNGCHFQILRVHSEKWKDERILVIPEVSRLYDRLIPRKANCVRSTC